MKKKGVEHATSRRKRLLLEYPGYMPWRLLNRTAQILKARNDFHLSQIINFDHAQLYRIRHRQDDVVSDRLMIKIMDYTGMTIQEVRELGGIPMDIDLM